MVLNGKSLTAMANTNLPGSSVPAEQLVLSRDGADDATCRSSCKHVSSIIQKFSLQQQELVKSIGFGEVLKLPQINGVDRRFTTFLLTKLDPVKSTLVIGSKVRIKLTDESIYTAIGIPCGMRPVRSGVGWDANKKLDFITNSIGSNEECNAIKAARAVVEKKRTEPMDSTEIEHFKVSFVVWLFGYFLAPVATTKQANHGDFWGSLLDTSDIRYYNWCAYVLDKLLEAAERARNDQRTKEKISNVLGCGLLLQVCYLEKIDLGVLNKPQRQIPKIAFYDCQSLKKMMDADMASTAANSDNPTFGCNKMRKRELDARPTQSDREKMPDRTFIPPPRQLSDIGPELSEGTSVNDHPVDTSGQFDYIPTKDLCTELVSYIRNSTRGGLTQDQASALLHFNAKYTVVPLRILYERVPYRNVERSINISQLVNEYGTDLDGVGSDGSHTRCARPRG